jgi:hypothetical protein
MRILRAAATYFGTVFAVGFVLGCVRVPLLVPWLGATTAERIELPIMVLLCAVVARWRVARTRALPPRQQLAVGAIAWLLLLAAECALGAALQDRGPRDVLLGRDPLTGALYHAALVAFAMLPWLWARRAAAHAAHPGRA